MRLTSWLATILGDEDGELPTEARKQAALPIRLSGLGVRRAADHSTCCCLGCLPARSFLCACSSTPSHRWDAQTWKETAERHNECVLEADRIATLARPEIAAEAA